jgi:hypothetical protein
MAPCGFGHKENESQKGEGIIKENLKIGTATLPCG